MVGGGKDSSVDKSSAFHAGDLGSNPNEDLTQVTRMGVEEITSCKSHIVPVSLTD